MDEIDELLTNISLTEGENEHDINSNWFKAYIEACFYAEDACKGFTDTYGPYETYAECFERTKEMMVSVREALWNGKFGYKCVQSEQSIWKTVLVKLDIPFIVWISINIL